jgi:CRM1 C terminal
MDSINWAFRHTERNIAETGLSLLLELLKNFQVIFYTILVFENKPSCLLDLLGSFVFLMDTADV